MTQRAAAAGATVNSDLARILARVRRPLCAAAVGALLSCSPDSALAVDAKEVFIANCAPCHGPDGKAKTPVARKLGVKDLTQSKLGDAEIKKQIIEGRKDKSGKQQMPAFEDKIPAEHLDALVAFVKEFRKK